MSRGEVPVIASVDDIDAELATRAFSGTSFSPSERGQSERELYAGDVNQVYANLWTLAVSEKQRGILAEEMERFRHGYLKRLKELMHVRSGILSAYVAGPSKFPARRMEKQNAREQKKLSEFLEWRTKAIGAIKKSLINARTPYEQQIFDWLEIGADIRGSLYTITGIDKGLEPGLERALFVNSIAGKVERLAKNGEVELVMQAQALVCEHNSRVEKPAISPRHKFWKLAEVAQASRDEQNQARQRKAEVLFESDAVSIIADPIDERVRISFSEQPSKETINKLKAAGWHWSKWNCAWQRKLTPAAKHSAMYVTGMNPTQPRGGTEL